MGKDKEDGVDAWRILKGGEMKGKKIGYVEIKRERGRFEPNFIVYVLTKERIKTTDDFESEEWDYAYKLQEEGIEIRSIEPATRLPKLLTVIQQVSKERNEIWYGYEMPVWCEDKDVEEIEWRIRDWLEMEYGYELRPILKVVKLPKIVKKVIPITLPPGKTIDEWVEDIVKKKERR